MRGDYSRNKLMVQHLKVMIRDYKKEESRYIGRGFFDGQDIVVFIPESIIPKSMFFIETKLNVGDEILVQAEWTGDDNLWIAERVVD